LKNRHRTANSDKQRAEPHDGTDCPSAANVVTVRSAAAIVQRSHDAGGDTDEKREHSPTRVNDSYLETP
jgi:hypothetical protein